MLGSWLDYIVYAFISDAPLPALAMAQGPKVSIAKAVASANTITKSSNWSSTYS